MLKTTIKVENYTCGQITYENAALGARFTAPAYATGAAAVTFIVDAGNADAVMTDLSAKYSAAVVVTDMGDHDDGVNYPYSPFILHNLSGSGAPAATNDDSEGYSVGSVWIDTASAAKAVYQCTDSTADAAVWENLSDQPLDGKTPVNAVAAARVLTVSGQPAEGDTVSAGGVTYKFRAAIGAGAKAAKTLTISGVAKDGETVTIDTTDYTFVDALTSPAVANEVLVEATAEAAIDNLVAAATGGAGAGTKYGTGTVAHTTVDVTKVSASTVVATAKDIGFAGNSIAIDESMDNGSWAAGATALSGGVDAQAANDVLIGSDAQAAIDNLVLAITAGAGAGTNYGTGTVVNPLVTAAKASASTMSCTNKIKGVIGNSTVIAKSGTNLTWASSATVLAGGVNGTLGVAREICADTSWLYVCVAANTIADANWRRVTLGSAY
jgi:hypothetical protein